MSIDKLTEQEWQTNEAIARRLNVVIEAVEALRRQFEQHIAAEDGADEQPMPTPGGADVPPYARDRMVGMLAARRAKGIAAYGTPLQTHNGRDALRDAMEECADLWQYLCQMEMERANVQALRAERDAAQARVAALEKERNQALCDAGDALAERDALRAQQASAWHDATTDPPDYSGKFWVCYQANPGHVVEAWYLYNDNCVREWVNDSNQWPITVTHWQPLVPPVAALDKEATDAH